MRGRIFSASAWRSIFLSHSSPPLLAYILSCLFLPASYLFKQQIFLADSESEETINIKVNGSLCLAEENPCVINVCSEIFVRLRHSSGTLNSLLLLSLSLLLLLFLFPLLCSGVCECLWIM